MHVNTASSDFSISVSDTHFTCYHSLILQYSCLHLGISGTNGDGFDIYDCLLCIKMMLVFAYLNLVQV